MARIKDEQLHEQRRLQILEAAATVFRQKGFHAARTEEICSTSGLSAGTVFRYFRSKEDIIAAISEMEMATYREQLKALGSKEGILWLANLTPAGLAELMAPSQFELGTDSWLELCRNTKYRDTLIAQNSTLRSELAQVLAAGQKEGWVRADLDPAGAATALFALFSGLMFEAESGMTLDMEASARALSDLFRRFLLP